MTLRSTLVKGLLIFCSAISPICLEAKTRPASVPGASYISALAAADHFLQAWQTGDVEAGMVLLSAHAKESARAEAVKEFFSNPESQAYEIVRGKVMSRDRYEFAVVLFTSTDGSKNRRSHRRFASLIVVNTGPNDWQVDKLP